MPSPLRDQVNDLLQKIADVTLGAQGIKGRRVTPSQREQLRSETEKLRRALDAGVYTHPLPPAVFDPSDTRLFGRFAAIALVAQQRIPLPDVEHVYGSGIYALYYTGSSSGVYKPIASTENPIYVGKVQPEDGAIRVEEQGTAITTRLKKHASSINDAANLKVSDFECRYLVIAAGWETPAELELTRFFRPLWNSPGGPVHGIGKHGDSADTRGNRRSPWDTLHPGRGWATASAQDQRSAKDIRAGIAAHLKTYPPILTRQDVFDAYIGMLATPTRSLLG